MTRWVIATVVFVAIGLADSQWGHGVALGLLVALLVVVAVFGGSRHK